MNYLETANWESTVHDYEFTRKARRQIMEVVSAESFTDMDSEEIFQFLFREISLVSFKDYLKRYLYERAGITEPFREIDDSVWLDIIVNAFDENQAPHSFAPTSTKWSTTVKSWLNSDRVRRSTVFLLGFGLRMTEEDVADFLSRVLEEDSYHMDDPTEVIFRYCYRHNLSYARALQLKEQAESSGKADYKMVNEKDILRNDASLLSYVSGLSKGKEHEWKQDLAFLRFEKYYEEGRKAVVKIWQNEAEWVFDDDEARKNAEDVSAADLEKILCSGIPTTESGNLAKSGQSLLSRHFQNYRLSRQRMDSILKKKLRPDRYDLITLAFFLYAQKEDISGEERLSLFLEEINPVLESCGMYQMHPANPYEAFIMISLLSDCPLGVYGDIWEISYTEQ